MKSLDDVRAKYPHLGVACYAYTPGGVVTLECLSTDGKTFKFDGRTEAEAISKAFDEDQDTPSPAPPKTEPTTPPTSVFD